MKLLLIETDELLREMYASAFRTAGYEVITLKDVGGIAKAINDYKPSYVVSRVILPGLKEGEITLPAQILQELRGSGVLGEMPVVFMDNLDADSRLVKEALQVGVGYVVMAEHTPSRTIENVSGLLRAN